MKFVTKKKFLTKEEFCFNKDFNESVIFRLKSTPFFINNLKYIFNQTSTFKFKILSTGHSKAHKTEFAFQLHDCCA